MTRIPLVPGLQLLASPAFFDADKRWLDHHGFRPIDLPALFGGLSS